MSWGEGPRQGAWRFPAATLLLALAAVALWMLGDPAQAAAQYDRAAIAAGEVRRLLTGHLTHCSFSHLAWDLLMFVVLGGWIERRSRGAWFAVVVGSALLISAGLWLLRPELAWYRGLSGIDTALFAWVMVSWWPEGGWLRRLGLFGLVGMGGKTMYELTAGATLFANLGSAAFAAEPLAHLIGAGVGALVAGWMGMACRFRPVVIHSKNDANKGGFPGGNVVKWSVRSSTESDHADMGFTGVERGRVGGGVAGGVAGSGRRRVAAAVCDGGAVSG